MVEGGTSSSRAVWSSSTSSHSSSSSSSSKGRDTRLLIRVSPSVKSERIHSFFDRSLTLSKPPIGCGFVKKVSRKGDNTVVVSIEDASIARRLVSSFSDSRPKIDGHEFSIEYYKSSDEAKSLSSPSFHNGDKKREKESSRMTSCSSLGSPSSKRSSHSTSHPSTSREESTKEDNNTSSPSDPYKDVIGEDMIGIPTMSQSMLKEVLIGVVQDYGGYLSHFNEDSGGTKVIYKKHEEVDDIPPEGPIKVQETNGSFKSLSTEETRRLYDRYLSSNIPSTSSSSFSSSIPSTSDSRDALSYSSSRTIYIPCLRRGETIEDIRKRFHRLCPLEIQIRNGQSISPHAIVQFAHTQGAVSAMEFYEKEQKEAAIAHPERNRKRPSFHHCAPSHRVWVANLPPQDEDYVKKKLLELLKGAQNPTIVVDLRRREGIIDFTSPDKAKHFLQVFKSCPLHQQGGSVQTWLIADYCSDKLYSHFIERRGHPPNQQEIEFISIIAKMTPTELQKSQANERMKSMRGGDEKKKSMNGENGHPQSPSSTRRLNGEDRRSGDSGFSEDRDKGQPLDSDDDEVKRFDSEKYRGKDPLKSPPIAESPFNGDKEKKHIVTSPPFGSAPAQLHITIPPTSSTHHSNHSPYPRVPSTSSSRHPSVSTPTLTPRSNTLPSSSIPRPPFPSTEHNGDHHWNSVSSNTATPPSSRLPLSRRESVCSNSSQSHTPLPPSGANAYTPTSLKSPPANTWSSTGNTWKGGPSLSSPLPSSIHRSRPSIDHKSSTSSLSRPPGLPKSNMDKCAFGLGPSSLPKTPSLPRSTSMNEKKPNISRESSKDIVNNIIQNKSGHLKNMQRIPKKENRERDEKEEKKEKKREEKDRDRRDDRDERKEKKEDRKKSRENDSKEERTRRKELKRKEREKEGRKKLSNEKEKKRKSIDMERKKKKKRMSESADSDLDSDESLNFKSSSSKQIDADAALARQIASSFGGSMYDRVKVRRSGGGKEEKKKSDALEAIRRKNVKKTNKKRVHLSSSDESDEEMKEKKKREEEEESSEDDEEERIKKEKKKEKKREKERRETSDESDSEEEREKKRKKDKKVLKKPSTLDLFSDADSVKSDKKEKVVKKRSYDKEEKLGSPSTSVQPPPEKKIKKEESSSQSDSEDEGERSSKKSEISTSSWRGIEDKNRRLSESTTHSEKDEVWKSPASGSVEKDIKEEPKEDRPLPRLMTKAAMKEFNVGASSSPAGSNWMNSRDDRNIHLSSDSSQSSSDSEDDKDIEEMKEEEEEKEEKIEERKEDEEKEEPYKEMIEEEVKTEEDVMEIQDNPIEERKEDEKIEEKEEIVKMEVEESQSVVNDEGIEKGLELPSNQVIEETEKAVESIFDEEEEPEARYPSNDFLNVNDMNLSSSSSQCSSPKLVSTSLPHRPTPLHPHLLHSHSIPPLSSPLISPHPIASPSTSRPSSIVYNPRPISQESSSQLVHDDNGMPIQEKAWTPQGSSSDGPSPSPNHHQMMNKEEIKEKFPIKWQGTIGVKKNDIHTQWCILHGNENLLNSIFPLWNSTIRVTQKFRLDNENIQDLVNSIERSEDSACLVVIPAGTTTDQVIINKDNFTKHLVNFFTEKAIAGITELVHPNGQPYVCHYFAPGQFVTDYLSPKYPDFLELLNSKYHNQFLLALLKRKPE